MNAITDEKQFFSLFIDKNCSHESILSPHDRGEFVMASDTHILIKISKSLLSQKYEEATKPQIPKIKPNANIRLTYKQLEKALSNYAHEAEEEEITPAVRCTECAGSGIVDWEYRDSHYHFHYNQDECPICRGTGNEKEAVTRLTGRSFPVISPLEINGVIFNTYYIGVILETMKQLGLTEIYHTGVYPGARPNLFKLDDGIEVILMPLATGETPAISIKGKALKKQNLSTWN